MGRLIGTTTQYAFLPGITYSNAYGYDAASNRTSFTAPDGSTNTYVYDTLNRLATLTNSLTGQFGFTYDALSRRTALNCPNGINTTYGYDSLWQQFAVSTQSEFICPDRCEFIISTSTPNGPIQRRYNLPLGQKYVIMWNSDLGAFDLFRVDQ